MRPSYCPECNGALDIYAPDCPRCGARVNDDVADHHDEELQVDRDRSGKAVEVRRKWKLHVPWGLFLLFGLYGAAAYAYVDYTDHRSPEALAAQNLELAAQLIGPDNGETARDADLQAAYQHLVDGLAVNTDDAWGHKELEVVTFALARRGQKPPADLKRRADFLAANWNHLQQARTSNLPESPRERFEFDRWEDKASRLKRYLGFGGVIIVLLWIYREFQDYKFLHKRDDEHELLRRDELRDLDSHRRRRPS
jgi:hypothetical protein